LITIRKTVYSYIIVIIKKKEKNMKLTHNLLFTSLCTVIMLTTVQAKVLHINSIVYDNSLNKKSDAYLLNSKTFTEQKSDTTKEKIPTNLQNQVAWIKDPITGCQVMISKAKGDETVSWSGDCQDGKASGNGVLVVLADNKIVARFEGTMANGKAEGRGKLDFKVEEGYAHYDGDFRNSELNGLGVLLFPDNSRAEGNFANDNMNGYIKATLSGGGSYEGEVKNNIPHGKGLQITPQGEEYYGDFVEGKMEGNGTLLYADGDIYVGQFKNDLADGMGTLNLADGSKYNGPFKNGKPNGEGVFTSANGDSAKGLVVNGDPDGKIIFTLKNGGTREEIWKNGKKIK
jgi:hypothetical protein